MQVEYWDEDDSVIDHDFPPDHFAVHSVSINGSVYVHCFAVASWPQHHPDINFFGKPYIPNLV